MRIVSGVERNSPFKRKLKNEFGTYDYRESRYQVGDGNTPTVGVSLPLYRISETRRGKETPVAEKRLGFFIFRISRFGMQYG